MQTMEKMEEQNQQQREKDDFLIRGKGKFISDYKKRDFYKFYRKNHKAKPVTRQIYFDFTRELLTLLGEVIITEGIELKLYSAGSIRVQAIDGGKMMLDKEGNLRKPNADWQRTWEFWYNKYPGLTRKEIVALPNKKVIFHENQHSNGEIYKFFWDRTTVMFNHQPYYEFVPTRTLDRLLAKTVKDPNRKVYYYG